MTLPALGFDEVIGIGKESSTYGTAAAPSVWFRPLSFDPGVDDSLIASPAGAGAGVPFAYGYSSTDPRAYERTRVVRPTWSFEAEADDIGWILEAMLGTGSHSTPDAELHQFDAITSVPANMPDALTVVHGNTVQDLGYTGCRIATFELAARSDPGIIVCTLGMIGQSFADDSVGSPSYSAAPFLEYTNCSVRTDTATTIPHTSADDLTGGEAAVDWTLRIGTPVREAPQVGSALIREPFWNDYWSAELEINKDWFSTDQYDVMIHATKASRFLSASVFMDTNIVAGGGENYSLEWEAQTVLLQGDVPGYGGGADVLPETLRFMVAHNPSTGVPFSFKLKNATATGSYSS